MTERNAATFARGGTSKGLFFVESGLPPLGSDSDHTAWDRLFASARDGLDLDYTFGQVSVSEAAVDCSGDCGNLSSWVVPFALSAGLISAADGRHVFRLFNTNTEKLVDVGLTISDGQAESPEETDANSHAMGMLAELRRNAAVRMGQCKTPEEASDVVSKVAVATEPKPTRLLDGTTPATEGADLPVRMISMGQTYKAVPGAVGPEMRLAIPSGVVTAGAVFDADTVTATSLFRTARVLMRGQVAVTDWVSPTVVAAVLPGVLASGMVAVAAAPVIAVLASVLLAEVVA
ncbi:hypothetical protein D3I60_04370 [Brevibacterium permense]|uniref:PrpF domain-containing protein n=1 Tax=Brevibacterium permense TaxID=234834 RepID=UPI0021D1E021|nr:PrpF domain-containing protein [Brevibacterium permense]MCU4296322.1 hypothetical protein [Brevibacterium permense]